GDVEPAHRVAQPGADLGDDLGFVEVRGRGDDRLRVAEGIVALEDAAADEVAFRAQLHHQRRVRRRGDATRGEVHHGQRSRLVDLLYQLVRRVESLCFGHQLIAPQRLQPADATLHRAHVAHRLDDVAGARLTLGADHRGALADAPQRFTEVARAAYEGYRELPLVDVVLLIRGREHLGLIDVVDAERLQHLRLDEVTDACLGHDRDGHRGDDVLDQRDVAHPSDAAVAADVRRNPLERHHGDGAGVLRDLRLLRVDDVHDDAALQHLCQPALDTVAAGGVLVAVRGRLLCGHRTAPGRDSFARLREVRSSMSMALAVLRRSPISVSHGRLLLRVAVVAASLVALKSFVIDPLTGHFTGTFEDFSAYFGAARSIAAGGSPYAQFDPGTVVMSGLIYPPFAALLLRPLAPMTEPEALTVWLIGSLACTVAAAIIVARTALPAR